MSESALIAFYRGEGRDHRGRLLSHIHQYSFDSLERHHDYIQWLFPLQEPSAANPDAPLLTSSDIAAFAADESLRAALLRSFRRMLEFYSLELVEDGDTVTVTQGDFFDEYSRIWLTPGNHNFLRISRMLRSMSLLGLNEYARAFLTQLEEIYADHESIIGATTLGYWRRAAIAIERLRSEQLNTLNTTARRARRHDEIV